MIKKKVKETVSEGIFCLERQWKQIVIWSRKTICKPLWFLNKHDCAVWQCTDNKSSYYRETNIKCMFHINHYCERCHCHNCAIVIIIFHEANVNMFFQRVVFPAIPWGPKPNVLFIWVCQQEQLFPSNQPGLRSQSWPSHLLQIHWPLHCYGELWERLLR